MNVYSAWVEAQEQNVSGVVEHLVIGTAHGSLLPLSAVLRSWPAGGDVFFILVKLWNLFLILFILQVILAATLLYIFRYFK